MRKLQGHIINLLQRRSYVELKAEHTVNKEEIRKFNILSKEWWNPHGPLRLLHKMNSVRIPFIQQQLLQHNNYSSLNALKILDIGCGAGILSEPLARLGAIVTGIDASAMNIEFAKEHYNNDPSLLKSHLKYMHSSTTSYLNEVIASNTLNESKFDALAAMEIIEHVNQPQQFIVELSQLIQPSGMVFLSTINRTLLAKILTIDLAESVLGIVDKGTHDFDKYIPPEDLERWLHESGFKVTKIQGVTFIPFMDKWVHVPFRNVNYMIAAKKI